MKTELKQLLRVYSQMILFGNDSEADLFLQENPSLLDFINKLKEKQRFADKREDMVNKIRDTLCLDRIDIPRTPALILARESHDSKQDLGLLANKYHQLTRGGLHQLAATGALCYEVSLSPNQINIPQTITNYSILLSTYPLGNISLDIPEIISLKRAINFLHSPESRREFALGIRATRNDE